MKKNVAIMSAILLVIAVLAVSCASGGGGKAEQAPPVIVYSWNFEDAASGTAGWYMVPDEYWDFHGTAELSRDDKTFGKPMLRMDVDYSKDAESEWSEPKMMVKFDPPIKGIKRLTFDFIYNPSFSKGGHFKSKTIIRNGKGTLAEGETGAIIAREELAGGYVKGTVRIIVSTSNPVDNMLLSIAGYKINYKGPVFFDNIRLE